MTAKHARHRLTAPPNCDCFMCAPGSAPPHRPWCDRTACTATSDDGEHQGQPVAVTSDGATVALVLRQYPGGPVRLTLGLATTSVVLDLDAAAQLSAWVDRLLSLARPTA
jgi:hypothetical protein